LGGSVATILNEMGRMESFQYQKKSAAWHRGIHSEGHYNRRFRDKLDKARDSEFRVSLKEIVPRRVLG
jgi:hypothetical protein